ncbi:MAG: S-layer homology domain-containing protein, partial [Tumebacillaceae bacterium]
FAVMLTSAYHLKATHGVTFDDAKNNWYTNAVATVAENGYMSGYAGNRFGPNDPITQEQVASIVMRALHKANLHIPPMTNVTILNQSQVHDWALSDVLEGKALGLYGDKFGATDFSPRTAATRADVAMVLEQALNAK